MKKPWQVWIVFALCLSVVLPAMVWLSFTIVELDRSREEDRLQTELARREAELQERISSALWRLDSMLTPHLAQEAARPYYLYESFYQVTNPLEPPSKDKLPTSAPLLGHPSPLLFQPSDFVKLHFQIGPDDEITSPQLPQGDQQLAAAVACGLTPTAVKENDERLADAKVCFTYSTLLYACPTTQLPSTRRSAASVPVQDAVSQIDQGGDAQQLAQRTPAQLEVLSQTAPPMYTGPPVEQIRERLNEAQQTKEQIAGIKNPPKNIAQQQRNSQRAEQELLQRFNSAQTLAYNQWIGNNSLEAGWPIPAEARSAVLVREGVMRPMWIEDELILARRVKTGEREDIQCCWLDWETINQALLQEVGSVLPNSEFAPIRNDDEVPLGRALATLPIQLVIDTTELMGTLNLETTSLASGQGVSGLWISLIVAWCGLCFTVVAVAALLSGVIRLSERRGAFVSAVTHELRTPLTTFRMYAEMLAEKMVPSQEKQLQYAKTLKTEAERLSHLVENVLQFAKLERGLTENRRERVAGANLLDRFIERLRDRADQAGMRLTVTMSESLNDMAVLVDLATLEQIFFNLVDNACKYAKNASEKRIEIAGDRQGRRIRFSVRDYGPGVDSHIKKQLFLPFRKSDQQAANSAPGVGLGLALCRRMAKSLNGKLSFAETEIGAAFVLEIPVQ